MALYKYDQASDEKCNAYLKNLLNGTIIDAFDTYYNLGQEGAIHQTTYSKVEKLINAGADPNTVNDDKENYLHCMMRDNSLSSDKIVCATTTWGIDRNQQNKNGLTPIQLYKKIIPIHQRNADILAAFGELDCRYVLDESDEEDVGKKIFIYLTEQNSVPCDEIEYLARTKNAKEQVLAWIKKLSQKSQAIWVNHALDTANPLGQFFAVKRNRLGSGAKAELEKIQKNLAALGVSVTNLEKSLPMATLSATTTPPAYPLFPVFEQRTSSHSQVSTKLGGNFQQIPEISPSIFQQPQTSSCFPPPPSYQEYAIGTQYGRFFSLGGATPPGTNYNVLPNNQDTVETVKSLQPVYIATNFNNQ